MQALRVLLGGTVSVGLVSTAKDFAPKLLAQFSARHPGIDVRFSEGNRETLIRLLEDNEIDLAVMGRPPEKLDAATEAVAENPHVLVAAANHPLARARAIDMHELRPGSAGSCWRKPRTPLRRTFRWTTTDNFVCNCAMQIDIA